MPAVMTLSHAKSLARKAIEVRALGHLSLARTLRIRSYYHLRSVRAGLPVQSVISADHDCGVWL